MTLISHDSAVATTINVFQVAPQEQQEALEMLTAMARHLLETVPGLLSANFLISTDGQRIVNYAQYTDEAAIAAVEAGVHKQMSSPMGQKIRQLTRSDFHTYSVATIIEASADQEIQEASEDGG